MTFGIIRLSKKRACSSVVEHYSYKVAVDGSNPSERTKGVQSSSSLTEPSFFSPISLRYFSVVESRLWPASLEITTNGVPEDK